MPDKPRPTIREVLRTAEKELTPKRITCPADHDLGQLEAELLLAHVLKQDRVWLRVHDTETLRGPKLRQFQQLVARRKKHEPIAYIVGHKEFYQHTFVVNKNVLIPRPESELLVERVIELHSELVETGADKDQKKAVCVLDIGTGSGAIAISIAKNIQPHHVLATDISAVALFMARKNAKRLEARNLTFLKADLLNQTVHRFLTSQKSTHLVIIANLPYLPMSDKQNLEADVVKYEPSTALFARKDGLELIEKLHTQLASSRLPFSALLLEYDPPQTKKLRALAKSFFPTATIRIHQDLAKRDRVLEIRPTP